MNITTPWHARLARTLAILLPLFLMVAALGTKFDLWGWQVGLAAFGLGGLILIGSTALVAIVSLILILRARNRIGLISALFALVVALGFTALFAPVVLGAGNHPIHDMATDTANPPAFSDEVLAMRSESGANPLNAYDTPLGETEQFASAEPPLSNLTTGQIIAEKYPELEPLAIGDTETDAAVNALQLAMAEMEFSNIRYNPEAGTVEGVAETFWFGFKDDVVARVSDGKIDFRSVSRVGQSDLGANAKRILALRELTAQKLGL